MARDYEFGRRIRQLIEEYHHQEPKTRADPFLAAFREVRDRVIRPAFEETKGVWPGGAKIGSEDEELSIELKRPGKQSLASAMPPMPRSRMRISADFERKKVLCVAEVARREPKRVEWEASDITDDLIQGAVERFVRQVLGLA